MKPLPGMKPLHVHVGDFLEQMDLSECSRNSAICRCHPCIICCVPRNESRSQARVRRAGAKLVAETVMSSVKQKKISVKWRKTPEERKYDVIDSEY